MLLDMPEHSANAEIDDDRREDDKRYREYSVPTHSILPSITLDKIRSC